MQLSQEKVNHILEIREFRKASESLLVSPMLPSEFCRIWVQTKEPGEHGYRSECVRVICSSINLKFSTVNAWGRKREDEDDSNPGGIEGLDRGCPHYAQTALRLAHIAKTMFSLAQDNSTVRRFVQSKIFEE